MKEEVLDVRADCTFFFSIATLVYLPGATVVQFPLVVVKDGHVM